jgi:hypothetical protein
MTATSGDSFTQNSVDLDDRSLGSVSDNSAMKLTAKLPTDSEKGSIVREGDDPSNSKIGLSPFRIALPTSARVQLANLS